MTRLNSATSFSRTIEQCATRYVLSDDLTRLCTALAYSKGSKALACADLLYVPAERVWIEWTEAPWRIELERYGFKHPRGGAGTGRRGIYIQSTPQARRGAMTTFWAAGEPRSEVFAGNMEAYFDFDATGKGSIFQDHDHRRPMVRVFDHPVGDADILRSCFGFCFERSWYDYYDAANLSLEQSAAIVRHALGTIAIDIPVVLAFLLLLNTRPGLPRRPLMLERINRLRARDGRTRLLDQVEVFSPLLPTLGQLDDAPTVNTRRASKLHHVRGHLVRRGTQIFWRVPHLRGSSRLGMVRSRTVTWTIDRSS